ncbi:molybdenum cofactor sulfurase, putative [Bodo saltans]|uniref:Molybdenum cofactor sulfurase, putative n=1 Tax=Bodo saltans TaxID=75058 RepID=A0A0S4J5Y6_BODSA|nr:molybdenum cofactor sulfurase, putative [Bodo saltans]|eukprot:CUG84594.1 molybdenum cofactor sulfurase, putative [Bodo saltans]
MKHWKAVAAAVGAGLVARWASGMLLNAIQRSQSLKNTATVTSLFVFPIKGVGGFEVQEWPLGPHGLLWDREWAVGLPKDDGSYQVVSSNRLQRLAAATASIDLAGQRMTLTAPGVESLTTSVRQSVAEANVTLRPIEIFGMPGSAVEESAEATAWWRRAVGNDDVVFLRIVTARMPQDSPNHQGCPVTEADSIGFHDYAALHIITREGVAWLDTVIPRDHQFPGFEITEAQFRANVVVEGLPFPDEDTWSVVTIGATKLRVAKQSGRCVIPTHNAAGERHPRFEPTATLRRVRRAFHRHQLGRPTKEGLFMFGLDLFHDAAIATGNILRVGDTLTVTERQTAPEYF